MAKLPTILEDALDFVTARATPDERMEPWQREALRGVFGNSLSLRAVALRSEPRGDRGDRLYLLRDLALRIANRRRQ